LPGDFVITSRDSAAACLSKAGVGEERIAWRDVLYDGPVRPAESLGAMTAARADYLSSRSWAFRLLSQPELLERDRLLETSATYDRVWLWFGHNAADQLQLLQVLHWFKAHPRPPETLILVEADDLLSELQPDEMLAYADRARQVSEHEIELGAYAFDAFCQPTPEAWAQLLQLDTSALPYLRATVQRLLEELPAPFSGLSRTEHLALLGMRGRAIHARELQLRCRGLEKVPFREDWSFYGVLDEISSLPAELISGHPGIRFNPNMRLIHWQTYVKRPMRLTLLGQNVLAGREDNADHNTIDRWWGGTHLTNRQLWRWSSRQKCLLPPGARPDESMKIVELRESPRRRNLKLAS
jgi:hypothetical protein